MGFTFKSYFRAITQTTAKHLKIQCSFSGFRCSSVLSGLFPGKILTVIVSYSFSVLLRSQDTVHEIKWDQMQKQAY